MRKEQDNEDQDERKSRLPNPVSELLTPRRRGVIKRTEERRIEMKTKTNVKAGHRAK
jgi:hypothetical protein